MKELSIVKYSIKATAVKGDTKMFENQMKGLDKGRRKQLLHKASDNTGSGRYNPSWVRKSGLRYTVLRWNIRPVRPSRPSCKLYKCETWSKNSYLTKPTLCQSRYTGYTNLYYYKHEMVTTPKPGNRLYVCLFVFLDVLSVLSFNHAKSWCTK